MLSEMRCCCRSNPVAAENTSASKSSSPISTIHTDFFITTPSILGIYPKHRRCFLILYRMRQKCVAIPGFQPGMTLGSLFLILKDSEHCGTGASHFRAQCAGGQHNVPNFADFRVFLCHHRSKYIGKPVGNACKVPLLQRRDHALGIRTGNDFRIVNGAEQRGGGNGKIGLANHQMAHGQLGQHSEYLSLFPRKGSAAQ